MAWNAQPAYPNGAWPYGTVPPQQPYPNGPPPAGFNPSFNAYTQPAWPAQNVRPGQPLPYNQVNMPIVQQAPYPNQYPAPPSFNQPMQPFNPQPYNPQIAPNQFNQTPYYQQPQAPPGQFIPPPQQNRPSFEMKPMNNPLNNLFGKKETPAARPSSYQPVSKPATTPQAPLATVSLPISVAAAPAPPLIQPQRPVQPAQDDFGEFSTTTPAKPSLVAAPEIVSKSISSWIGGDHNEPKVQPKPAAPKQSTSIPPPTPVDDAFDDFTQASQPAPKAVVNTKPDPVDLTSLMMQNLSVVKNPAGATAKATFDEFKKDKQAPASRRLQPAPTVKHESSKNSVNWNHLTDDVFADVRPKEEQVAPPSLAPPVVLPLSQPSFNINNTLQGPPVSVPFVPRVENLAPPAVLPLSQPSFNINNALQGPPVSVPFAPRVENLAPPAVLPLSQPSFNINTTLQGPPVSVPFIPRVEKPIEDDFDDFASAAPLTSAPAEPMTFAAPSSYTVPVNRDPLPFVQHQSQLPESQNQPLVFVQPQQQLSTPAHYAPPSFSAFPQPEPSFDFPALPSQQPSRQEVFVAPTTSFTAFNQQPVSITPHVKPEYGSFRDVFSEAETQVSIESETAQPSIPQAEPVSFISESFSNIPQQDDEFGGFAVSEPIVAPPPAVIEDADFGDFANTSSAFDAIASNISSNKVVDDNPFRKVFEKSAKYQQQNASAATTGSFDIFSQLTTSSHVDSKPASSPLPSIVTTQAATTTTTTVPKRLSPTDVYEGLIKHECFIEANTLFPHLLQVSHIDRAFLTELETAKASGKKDEAERLQQQWDNARKSLPAEYSRWEQMAQGTIGGIIPSMAQMRSEIDTQLGADKAMLFSERFTVYLPALATSSNINAAIEKQKEIHNYFTKLTMPIITELVGKWSRVLAAAEKEISFAYSVAQELSKLPPSDVTGLNTTERFSSFWKGVNEIVRMIVRIESAIQSEAEFISPDQLLKLQQRLRSLLAQVKQITTTLSSLGLQLIDLTSSVGVASQYKDGCAVCLGRFASEGPIKVAWGGQFYHAPCANFWFNRVDVIQDTPATLNQ